MSEVLIFDIGANCGHVTKRFIDVGCKVVAVEPLKYVSEEIRKFATEDQVTIINKLVHVSSEPQEFFMSNDDSVISTTSKDWMNHGRFSQTGDWVSVGNIESISLDEMVETYGTPHFIKIDVEGSEYQTLLSLTEKVNSILSIEWVEEFPEKTIQCVNYLKSLGYTHYGLDSCYGHNCKEVEDIVLKNRIEYKDINNFEEDFRNNLQGPNGESGWGDVYIR